MRYWLKALKIFVDGYIIRICTIILSDLALSMPMIVNIREFCCNKSHAAERMTVNHDVAGSSPAGGAISREWLYPKIYSFLIY